MTFTLSTSPETSFRRKLTSAVRKFWNPLTLQDLKEIKSLLDLKFSSDFIIKQASSKNAFDEFKPIFRCNHSVVLAFWLLCKRGTEKSVNSLLTEIYSPANKELVEITNTPLIRSRLTAGKSVQVAMLMLSGADLDLSHIKYVHNSNDHHHKKTLETYTMREFIKKRKGEDYDPNLLFRMDLALYLSSKQKTQTTLKNHVANPNIGVAERVKAYKSLAHFYENLWLGTLGRKSKKSLTRKDDGLRRCFVNKEKRLTKDGVILKVFLLLLSFQAYEDAMSLLNEYQQRGIETRAHKADLEYRMHELCDQLPKANNEHKLVDFWNLLIPDQMKHPEDRKQSYLSKITGSIYSTFSNRKGKAKLKNQLQYHPMKVFHEKEEGCTTNRI
jgi:hypothetical protein